MWLVIGLLVFLFALEVWVAILAIINGLKVWKLLKNAEVSIKNCKETNGEENDEFRREVTELTTANNLVERRLMRWLIHLKSV
ncbi:MAG: hypothetical protein LIO87_09955 [Eubacterium sp.]|nr:hypothetical protein [Eubacterium sp.]